VLNQAVHCHQHPQRLGIGICVECRQVVCGECSTPFEGINRCARCLARLAPRAQVDLPHREASALSLLGAAVALGLLFGGVLLVARGIVP
jgi:hypothetical protein